MSGTGCRLAIAAAAVLIVAAIVVFMMESGKEAATVTPCHGRPAIAYAASLPITNCVDERIRQFRRR